MRKTAGLAIWGSISRKRGNSRPSMYSSELRARKGTLMYPFQGNKPRKTCERSNGSGAAEELTLDSRIHDHHSTESKPRICCCSHLHTETVSMRVQCSSARTNSHREYRRRNGQPLPDGTCSRIATAPNRTSFAPASTSSARWARRG